MQDALPVIDEHFRHLKTVRFFIGDGVEQTVVKGENLRIGDPQQDGGMGHNDKLGSVPGAADDFQQQGQLSLRRQAGCWL